MSFWKRSKKKLERADIGQVQPVRAGTRRSPPMAMEVKLLAIEALESGAEKRDVASVIGVGPSPTRAFGTHREKLRLEPHSTLPQTS